MIKLALDKINSTEPKWTYPFRAKRSNSIASQNISRVPSEVVISCRIKYGNKWSALRGILADYSKSSSIHGMRYIFEIHRPVYEKVMWFICITMSLYAAITLISWSYMKWLNSPVVLVFDERLVPVHKIPFPTVTICPEIKMETVDFDFTRVSQQVWSEIEEYGSFNNVANISETDLKYLKGVLQICEDDVLGRFATHLSTDFDDSVVQVLLDLMPEHNKTLLFARWNARFYTSPNIFKYILTEEGICHQFNGMHAGDLYRDPSSLSYYDSVVSDFNGYFDKAQPKHNEITGSWSLSDGYVGQGFNSYPQRSVLSSARNGMFTLMMGYESNFEYACRSYKQGYKVFINSPESVPMASSNFVLVAHDHEVLISLWPRYIVPSPSLQSVNSEVRQCYFNNERYLRFFKTYSQSNCQIECLTNFTISQCGCAKFWMPKPKHIRVCGLADAHCFTRAADDINILISNQTQHKQRDPKTKIMCDCMPSCTTLDYDFEISQSYFDFEKAIAAHRDSFEANDGHSARLAIFYKESQFTAVKRSVVYSYSDLIANFGGILGLFMGISILSIVEFFYFFTMRLFRSIYKRKLIERKLKSLAN